MKTTMNFFFILRSYFLLTCLNCRIKKVREIIKDERSMLYQGGEDKLFYTAVKEENGVLCYDVYQYDCKTREKSVFLTEEQIRNALIQHTSLIFYNFPHFLCLTVVMIRRTFSPLYSKKHKRIHIIFI